MATAEQRNQFDYMLNALDAAGRTGYPEARAALFALVRTAEAAPGPRRGA